MSVPQLPDMNPRVVCWARAHGLDVEAIDRALAVNWKHQTGKMRILVRDEQGEIHWTIHYMAWIGYAMRAWAETCRETVRCLGGQCEHDGEHFAQWLEHSLPDTLRGQLTMRVEPRED
jgi:hypothetical protein